METTTKVHSIMEAPEGITALAVDADIVAYRCAAVCKGSDVDKLMSVLDEFLFNIVRDTGISRMTLYLSGSTNFRYDIAKTKEYKGNRKSIVRPRHIGNAKDYLEQRYGAILIKGYEADDAIASHITTFRDTAHAGIDKDIRQVPGWHYNFVKRIWEYTTEEASILAINRQICQGDTSDNIPGLPGIGEKKAAKAILEAFSARDEAIALYKRTMLHMKEEELMEFFHEQEALITLVDTLNVDLETQVIIEPPTVFEPSEDEEDDFMGELETAPAIDLN